MPAIREEADGEGGGIDCFTRGPQRGQRLDQIGRHVRPTSPSRSLSWLTAMISAMPT